MVHNHDYPGRVCAVLRRRFPRGIQPGNFTSGRIDRIGCEEAATVWKRSDGSAIEAGEMGGNRVP